MGISGSLPGLAQAKVCTHDLLQHFLHNPIICLFKVLIYTDTSIGLTYLCLMHFKDVTDNIKSESKKMRHIQKLAISKKSTVLVVSS